MSVVIELLVIVVMLLINGVFVAYEMALASVARARLAVLVGKKLKGATEAVFMKDNIEASFAVVQLGITFSTSIAAATGGLSASDTLSPWLIHTIHVGPVLADVMAIVFWVIPLGSVTIVFSELFPKLIALQAYVGCTSGRNSRNDGRQAGYPVGAIACRRSFAQYSYGCCCRIA